MGRTPENIGLPLIDVLGLTPGTGESCKVCRFEGETIREDEHGNKYVQRGICRLANGVTTEEPKRDLLLVKVVRRDYATVADRLKDSYSCKTVVEMCNYFEEDKKKAAEVSRVASAIACDHR